MDYEAQTDPAPVRLDPAPVGVEVDVPPVPAEVAHEFTSKPRHFPCFDGLRAIAAIFVLLLHTAWVSGFTLRYSLGIYTGRLEIGVSVFFLISGFLLYRPFALSHLSERPAPNVRRFWQRRFLRIVPAYWLALTVLTFVFRITTVGPGWQGFFAHYFFLQIYLPTGDFNGITQAWSLCTEVSFYLFLPLYAAVVGFRRRAPQRQLVWELVGLGVLTAISFAFRWWSLHLPILTVRNGKIVAICAPNCGTHATWPSLMPAWLPSYLDLFALGMLLAVAERVVRRAGCGVDLVQLPVHALDQLGLCRRLLLGGLPCGQRCLDPVLHQPGCQPRAADPLRCLRLLLAPAGGVRPPGRVIDPPIPQIVAHGQFGRDLLRDLSLAPRPDQPVSAVDGLAPGHGTVGGAGCGGVRSLRGVRLGQLLRTRTAAAAAEGKDLVVGSQDRPARGPRRTHAAPGLDDHDRLGVSTFEVVFGHHPSAADGLARNA